MNMNKLFAAVVLSATLMSSAFAADHYQQIRNATGRIEIAGKTFLIDPMLGKKMLIPVLRIHTTASCDSLSLNCR